MWARTSPFLVVNYAQNRRKEQVAIYGAGAAGRLVTVQVLHQRSDYVPVAFIDDAKHAQGTHVGGLMVYAPSQDSGETLIRNNGVNVVLLAMPSTSKARRGGFEIAGKLSAAAAIRARSG